MDPVRGEDMRVPDGSSSEIRLRSGEPGSRFRQVEALYQQAADLPPEQRGGFLAIECASDPALRAEVQTLLEHLDRAAGFLETPLHNLSVIAHRHQDVPLRIGRYRVLGRLGQGGMGSVYEAEQESPRRLVAIKLMLRPLPSGEALRRFSREAEPLGRLEHPGVARIYEAGSGLVETACGSCGSQPYLAMERVHGESLCAHAEARKLKTAERVALLAQISDAVHYAHQKGVLHRDLKPSNILVDERCQPRILDFGVARLLQEEAGGESGTIAGELLGTLNYMSPELLSGDPHAADTRSDIYSLGVVAFELLTGRLPVDVSGLSTPQAIRTLAESRSPPAGSLRRELRGDLEAILAKALALEPERRYASAAELAEDLRRSLRGEPIAARAPGALYLLLRFARRNRGLVVGAVLAALSLAGGALASAIFAWQARAAQARADTQARQAAAVAGFLRDMLASGDPTAEHGPQATIRDVIDEAAARLERGELADQPDVEATLRSTVGQAYLHLGLLPEARRQIEPALAHLRATRRTTDFDTISTLCLLAEALDNEGPAGAGEALLREALDASRALHGEQHRQTARVLNDLGSCMSDQWRLDEAADFHQQALAIRRGLSDLPKDELETSLINLAVVMHKQGRTVEAEPLTREALESRRRRLPPDHLQVGRALGNLAAVLNALGRLEEAEATTLEALAIERRVLGERHRDVAISLNNLGAIRLAAGKFPAAVEALQQCLEIRRAFLPEDDPGIGSVRLHLARGLNGMGDFAAADEQARLGLESLRVRFGPQHAHLAGALRRIGQMYIDRADLNAGEPLLREAIAILDDLDDLQRRFGIDARITLAAGLLQQRRDREAVELLEAACTLAEQFGYGADKLAAASRAAADEAAVRDGAATQFATPIGRASPEGAHRSLDSTEAETTWLVGALRLIEERAQAMTRTP